MNEKYKKQIEILMTEVEKQKMKNSYISFNALPDFLYDINNIKNQLLIEEVDNDAKKTAFEKQIISYIKKARLAFVYLNQSNKFPKFLSMRGSRSNIFKNFFSEISNHTEIVNFIKRESKLPIDSAIGKYEVWRSLEENKNKKIEVSKYQVILDIRDLLIGLLRTFGYSKSEIATLLK